MQAENFNYKKAPYEKYDNVAGEQEERIKFKNTPLWNLIPHLNYLRIWKMFKVPVLRKDVGLPKDIKIKWN